MPIATCTTPSSGMDKCNLNRPHWHIILRNEKNIRLLVVILAALTISKFCPKFLIRKAQPERKVKRRQAVQGERVRKGCSVDRFTKISGYHSMWPRRSPSNSSSCPSSLGPFHQSRTPSTILTQAVLLGLASPGLRRRAFFACRKKAAAL